MFLLTLASVLITTVIVVIMLLIGVRIIISLYRSIQGEMLGIKTDQEQATYRRLQRQEGFLDAFSRKNDIEK